MNIPNTAINALQVRNYLKKNKLEPTLVYENSEFIQSKNLWVYTFQCAFKTEKELEMFKKLCKLINAGILDNT